MGNEDKSKLEFTFDFCKDNFSKVKLDENFFSHEYSVCNMAWKLHIKRAVSSVNSEKHVLQCFLYVKGETKFWCCYARVRLTVLSQEQDGKNFSEYYERLFSSANLSWGYTNFKYWDELIDSKSGYIKNDTIKIRVNIVADPPQNVDPHYNKVAPVKSEDWLSLFENQLNKQIVSRISEEFKKVVSTVDQGFKSANKENCDMKDDICSAVREEITALEKYIGTVKKDVDALKQDVGTVKQDVNSVTKDVDTVKQDVSALKDHVSLAINAAVNELNNSLLKKDEAIGEVDDSCKKEEKKKKRNEVKDSHETEARNEDFVVNKLNEFKIEMMKEIFSHLSHWNAESRMLFGTSPYYGCNEPFYPHPNSGYGHKSESRDPLYGNLNYPVESARRDQFGRAAQNKSARSELGCNTSSSSLNHHLHEIEKYLEKDDGNDSDSSASVHFQQSAVLNSDTLQEELKRFLEINRNK